MLFNKIIRIFRSHRKFFLFFFLSMFHIINNIFILHIDTTPILRGEGIIFEQSITAYEDFKHGNIVDFITYHYHTYPNLFFWLNSLNYLIFGVNETSAILTNSFLMLILIFCVYGIGKKLHSKNAGLLAAFVITTFPHVFAMSRIYTSEFAVLTFLSITILTLLNTDKFDNLKKSLIFGFFLGITTLTKPIFIVFFVGPFLVYLFHSLFSDTKKNYKVKFVNILISLFLALIIAISWWNLSTINTTIKADTTFLPVSDISNIRHAWIITSPLSRIFYYFSILFGFEILYYYFFIFIIALLYFIFTKYKHGGFLLSGFFIPYIVLTILLWHLGYMRYIFPYLIFVALIISIFVYNIKKKKIRRCILYLTIIVGLSQYILLSYVQSSHTLIYNINDKLHLPTETKIMFKEDYKKFVELRQSGLITASTYDWNFDIILSTILHAKEKNQTQIQLGVSDAMLQPISYYNVLKEIKYADISVIPCNWPEFDVNSMDFIIYQDLSKDPIYTYRKITEIIKLKNHTLIAEVPWPFNMSVFIYRLDD